MGQVIVIGGASRAGKGILSRALSQSWDGTISLLIPLKWHWFDQCLNFP